MSRLKRHLFHTDDLRRLLRLDTDIDVHAAVALQLIPPPDQRCPDAWSRALAERFYLDRDTIAANLRDQHSAYLTVSQAARLITERLGLDDEVTYEQMRGLIRRGHLAAPGGVLTTPAAVNALLDRPDARDVIDAERLLWGKYAAERLGVRRGDWTHIESLQLIHPARWADIRFGSSRASEAPVPMYRTGDVDALPLAYPWIPWDGVRATPRGRPSALASLATQWKAAAERSTPA